MEKGHRGIEVSGSLDRSLLITGDRNIVFSGGAEQKPIGRWLEPEHFTLSPDAQRDESIVVGDIPRTEDIRRGRFRERPRLFGALCKAFGVWLQSLLQESTVPSRRRIPLFWVGGRSGEGKSVLLLQLAAAAVREPFSLPLLQLNSGADLPHLLAALQQAPAASGNIPTFVVVDDLYDLPERETWELSIINACNLEIPNIALIVCGPTEQREQFGGGQAGGLFQITDFVVPSVNEEEMQEFADWYATRTNQTNSAQNLTKDNTILVQLIFELSRGETLDTFAHRFRRRLERLHFADAAAAILAMNALYLDAPLHLLSRDADRDALERLCEEDQLHFKISKDAFGKESGVRLAHPHITWQIFLTWAKADQPTKVGKYWARNLFKSYKLFCDESNFYPIRSLLVTVMGTERMSDGDGPSIREVGVARASVLKELYEKVTDKGTPLDQDLTGWLEVQYKFPSLTLRPEPYERMRNALHESKLHEIIGPAAFAWVWRIAEARSETEWNQVHTAIKNFFLSAEEKAGVAKALTVIYAKALHREEANALVRDWLEKNGTTDQAYHVIAPLVATHAGDVAVLALAEKWLDANEKHPHAYHVIAPLVATHAGDAAVRALAEKWLDANEKHPHAYQLLASLVATHAGDAAVRALAEKWLDANEKHPQAYWLLASLVAAHAGDATVLALAEKWLGTNEKHPHAYHVIAPLVAAHAGDTAVRALAEKWLGANEKHPQAYHALSPLVAAHAGDAAVRALAEKWLGANEKHPQAYHALSPLVAAHAGDAAVRALAEKWLDANEKHPHAYQLLSSLAAAHAGDATVLALAEKWLGANEKHPQSYRLLAPLIAAHAGDAAVLALAEKWLDANEKHPQAYQLLITMIARTDGSPVWMLAGEQYVSRRDAVHPESVLVVLVSGSRGDSKYVEMGLRFVEQAAPKHGNFVKVHVGRTLIYNHENAILYLNGLAAHQDKVTVSHSIAYAAKNYPAALPDCLSKILPNIAAEYAGHILAVALRLGIEDTELDSAVVQWLNANYHRPAYTKMVNALRPKVQKPPRLTELGLERRILNDIRKQG